MLRLTPLVGLALLVGVSAVQAANHREAPITALDHKADITDVYAFRSYGGDPSVPRATLIMSVDPLLEPGNGPNWFPFDDEILYEIKIDNDHDAKEDIVFQFRFHTEQRLPDLFQVYAGAGSGVTAPSNAPPDLQGNLTVGATVIPPQITGFDSPGLGQRQRYTVTMLDKSRGYRHGTDDDERDRGRPARHATRIGNPTGEPFFAVPANVGPRTMDYAALFDAGTYATDLPHVKVFAGTTDDAFWIDLGGAFDTLNTSVSPVLSESQDTAEQNFAADTVSGYAVNSIAIEVPVALLTKTGKAEPADSRWATIGVWATTSRPRVTVRRSPKPARGLGDYRQVQRMGNPLINELLIGTGAKDRFSMDEPRNDSQFAGFFLDPALARILNAATGGAIEIPPPARTDLLPLVTYAPPIAAPGTPAGPIADLLRLNTGVTPKVPGSSSYSRLGLLGGDAAGYPNGRRLPDDVTDISLRAVAGVLAGAPFSTSAVNSRLGDGVNVNDAPYRTDFPYLADAPSGRTRRHIDPGEPGCTAGSGPSCAP
jgi:hypothetical protein